MSLNFVTRKLKTQKLADQEEDEEQCRDSECDGNADSDSGTESDDEHDADDDAKAEGSKTLKADDVMAQSMPKLPTKEESDLHGGPLVSFGITAPSEDNYSSEEELKEIISEKVIIGTCKTSGAAKKSSPSKKKEKKINDESGCSSTKPVPFASQTPSNTDPVPNQAALNVASKNRINVTPANSASTSAEKRKWSEVISDDDLAELDDDDGLELEMTSSQRSSSQRLYVRSSGGNTTTSSSCSNDDDSCVCGRKLTTPVQFCTSPPMDVHRPRRKPWTPPPPKVFHIMATTHSASFDYPTHEEEDDEITDIENMARPRQAAFVPISTGNGNEFNEGCSPSASAILHPSENGGVNHEEPNVIAASQYCPRHHHHTTTTQNNNAQNPRHTPSPSKRHRLTPRPQNIQRPCLDFEKMQQIKKRVVTSWRPQGAELSLFCW